MAIPVVAFDRGPHLSELRVSYRRSGASQPRVTDAVACDKYLRSVWDDDRMDWQEDFVVVCLTGGHQVLGWVRVATGGRAAVGVDPRVVLGVALRAASAAIIVAHNHPGGDCTPSADDRAVTRRLREAGDLLGVRLLDHLILTRAGHFSFAEAGEL